MRRTLLFADLLLVLSVAASPVFGDGGYFPSRWESETTDLAQTRQDVLLAIYNDPVDGAPQVTYVLRSAYTGQAEEFAWVVPVPDTPTDVVAHFDDELFFSLSNLTKPVFTIIEEQPPGYGTGCACGAMPTARLGGAGGDLQAEDNGVHVEDQGQAGIFEWAALTSTGSGALLDWLNENDYAVPAEAGDILDDYIQQGRHFLALRVSEPDDVQENYYGQTEIPPIQFTCQTSERFYPMVISQVSAADETEVVVYVLADHRAEAANLPNVAIDPAAVEYDPASVSQTNYEALLTQAIADHQGLALVTEYAHSTPASIYWGSAEVPPEMRSLPFLTRMRTVIARENMEVDFEFQDAADDDTVVSEFTVWVSSVANTAAIAGQPLAVLLLFGLFRAARVRRARRSRRFISVRSS